MPRIIGIDPGSRKTGIGIIDYDPISRQTTCILAKVLRLDLDQELPTRLSELAGLLQDLISEYSPHQAALEDVFVGDHARSALILGQSRGAVLAILGLAKVPVTSIAPRKVKQVITGHGQAGKNQVGEMVRLLLKLDKKPAEDAADALALALSCVFTPQAVAAPGRMSTKQKRLALAQIYQNQKRI
jgi:crossover junction endodeoxyribonuclease RuvC